MAHVHFMENPEACYPREPWISMRLNNYAWMEMKIQDMLKPSYRIPRPKPSVGAGLACASCFSSTRPKAKACCGFVSTCGSRPSWGSPLLFLGGGTRQTKQASQVAIDCGVLFNLVSFPALKKLRGFRLKTIPTHKVVLELRIDQPLDRAAAFQMRIALKEAEQACKIHQKTNRFPFVCVLPLARFFKCLGAWPPIARPPPPRNPAKQ